MDALLRRRAMIAAGGGSPTPPGPVIEPVFYDYLVFDGTAYIDTDLVPPASASFNVRLGDEKQKEPQRMFWYAGTDCMFGAILSSSTSSTKRYFGIYYGSSSAVSSNQRANNFSTTIYNFFLTPSRFGWGSTDSFTISSGSGLPTSGLVLGSNRTHTGQPFTGRMGVFYTYGSDAGGATKSSDFENYTPVYTLRPCTYNGEVGMWCVETSTFYGNSAGAGSLSVLNM